MVDLSHIYQKFPSHEDCINHLEQVIWDGRPTCPYCKSERNTPLPNEHRHHCNACNKSYAVTVNTLFHKTKIDLQKWFYAFLLIVHSEDDITVRQLAKAIGVAHNSAWFMLQRIRKAAEKGFTI